MQVLRFPKEAFAAAMQSWRERCEKCVCLQGDYVEKWLHFQLPVVSSFFKINNKLGDLRTWTPHVCADLICGTTVRTTRHFQPLLNYYNSKFSRVSTVTPDVRRPCWEVNTWDLRVPGKLRSVCCYLFTDISGKFIGSILKSQSRAKASTTPGRKP